MIRRNGEQLLLFHSGIDHDHQEIPNLYSNPLVLFRFPAEADSQSEIKGFHENFKKLDKTQKGFVSSYDLKQVNGIGQSSFGDRMADSLASNQQEVPFSTMAELLLSPEGDISKKRLLFSMIDISDDQLIDYEDLKHFFSEILKPQITENDLENLITSIISASCSKDSNASLDFEDFCAFLSAPVM